jgi:hypothetical protein
MGISTASLQSFTVQVGAVPTINSNGISSPLGGTRAVPGSTTINILGSNFTAASKVYFTTAAAIANTISAAVTFVDATNISVLVPATATTGPIRVDNNGAGGLFSAPSAQNVIVVAAATTPATPTITALSPTQGPTSTLVTITGTNFTPNSTVSFGGVNATLVSWISPTQLLATVPSSAVTGAVSVTTPEGGASIAALNPNFDVTSGSASTITNIVPSVTSFLPTTGPTGTVVIITGANFTPNSTVRFTASNLLSNPINTVLASNVEWVSATSLLATVPSGVIAGPITVTTPEGGPSPQSTTWFVPSGQLPTITSFTPTSGAVGATVTITGTNFTPQSTVQFTVAGSPGGGTGVVPISVNAAGTQLQVTIPATAIGGPIRVVNAAGPSALSSQNLLVGATPTIGATGLTPLSGPIGTLVTITGTNFSPGSSVSFNGAYVLATYVNSTTLRVAVPADAVTGQVRVQTPEGLQSAYSTQSFTVQSAGLPTIDANGISSPNSNLRVVPGTTTITINGTGFTDASKDYNSNTTVIDNSACTTVAS